MKFTEEKLERTFCGLPEQQGFRYQPGGTIVRKPDEVLIEEDFRSFLLTQYASQGITPNEVSSIILQLKSLPASDLYGSTLEQLHTLNLAVEYVQLTNELENRFMGMVKRLKAAYDICAGSEQDLFDEDYLAKIDKIKLPNTKIKLLQQLLARVISEIRKVNKVKGVYFTRKMQAIVERYNNRDDIKSALKVELILILDEFGYPPVERDEVYVEIFEQAENFKKNRS